MSAREMDAPKTSAVNVLTPGQSLVAAFRTARLRQRPALQTELRADRVALRDARQARLAAAAGSPGARGATRVGTMSAAAPTQPLTEPVGSPAGPSVFAQFIGDAFDEQQKIGSTADHALPVTAATQRHGAGMPSTEAASDDLLPDLPKAALPVVELAGSAFHVDEQAVTELPMPELSSPKRGTSDNNGFDANTEQAPPVDATPQPPLLGLSDIGFGPGMVIRFSQLGIDSVFDLASANPDSLRQSLGDISRLVNVDVWIASARRACNGAAGF